MSWKLRKHNNSKVGKQCLVEQHFCYHTLDVKIGRSKVEQE